MERFIIGALIFTFIMFLLFFGYLFINVFNINLGLEVFNIVIAFFTAIAAFAAYLSAWQIKKQVKYQKLNDLLNIRYSKEMYKSKLKLREYADKLEKKGIGIEDLKYLRFDRSKKEIQEIDEYRWFFYLFFRRIKDLVNQNILSEKDVRCLTWEMDVKMLIDISKPIEINIRESFSNDNITEQRFNDEVYEYFEKMFLK